MSAVGRRLARGVLACVLAAALCAPGCDGTSSVAAPSTGGAEGAECSPAQPCEGALLCLDGRCRVRAGAPDATAAPGTVVPPIPDGLWDDVALPDVATPDTGDASSGPDLDGPETADLPDTSSDAGDGGGPGDVGPSGDAIVLVFSEDEAELHPGDQALSIELGQGWVTELTVPYAGSIVGMQVMLINAFGPGSCARFAPAIWLPNAAGEFEDAPTWRAENGLALVGGPKPVSFFLSQKVQSKAGRIRLGLILNGPCETVSPLPLMASDDSGDLSRTWLWAPDATGSPWIDGELVGIDGRWGIAVLIEVVL